MAGAPAAAAAASMMASPAAAAASSRADVSAAAAQTPLPVVTLDELVVGAADDLPSEEEQENDDLDVHARPDQHYGNDSSSSEDEDDQLGGPDDRDIDQMIADDAAHDDLTAQVNGATGQLMGQTAASGGASGPSATAPATSDGDDAAAPDGAAAAPVIPKGKSPAHFDSEAGNLVFFDLDVEVGGPNCGINIPDGRNTACPVHMRLVFLKTILPRSLSGCQQAKKVELEVLVEEMEVARMWQS